MTDSASKAEPPPRARVHMRRSVHGAAERLELVTESQFLPRPMSVCVYRVGDALIDAGSVHGASALVEALRDDPPRRILLTHQHEDHIGGVAALREAFGDLPVFAPAEHLATIGAHPPIPPYRALTWGRPAPIAGLVPYAAGDVFEAGGVALEAYLTPGHTPGHIAFVSRGKGLALAFTADLYLARRPLEMWFESAVDDMRDSARKLARVGDDVVLLPAHGPVREDGRARLLELAAWLDRELAEVLDLAHRLGTRDLTVLTEARYGGLGPLAKTSGGEFSRRCLVRAILEPVRTLPAVLP